MVVYINALTAMTARFEARSVQQCFNCLSNLDADINFLFPSEVVNRTPTP